MQIFIKYIKKYELNVEPTITIYDLKSLIKDHIGMPILRQRLIFRDKSLDDSSATLNDYSIEEDTTIHLVYKLFGGGCNVYIPSSCAVRFMENDDTVYDYPLESGRLSNRYIRNTNATKVYDQLDTGTCYAHSAASAYINTILRIYGHKPPPTMEECFKIACYNGNEKGGDPEKSIRLLEEHFNYGILCESTYYNPTIREAMTISIILSFTTSKQGWIDVANGSLLEKADGIQTVDWHASLIEGYDFDHDCCVCKNSWGENTASGRFNIDPLATHDHYFTKVYFTTESIRGKAPEFIPTLYKVPSSLTNYKAFFMDKETATYSSEYVCEICKYDFDMEDIPYGCEYIGYDIDQWIETHLKRTPEFQAEYNEKHKKFILSKTPHHNQHSVKKDNDICLLL